MDIREHLRKKIKEEVSGSALIFRLNKEVYGWCNSCKQETKKILTDTIIMLKVKCGYIIAVTLQSKKERFNRKRGINIANGKLEKFYNELYLDALECGALDEPAIDIDDDNEVIFVPDEENFNFNTDFLHDHLYEITKKFTPNAEIIPYKGYTFEESIEHMYKLALELNDYNK